ncbi:hypothetical protein FB446DRAFT_464817 [Lentinula raphanica]|nr:hypothetical protein FB446DRAFT_464817 [Lentinula raphanica]
MQAGTADLNRPEVDSVLAQYLAFPFESDVNFKNGLSDIVSVAGVSSDVPEDTLQAMRVFYFNRMTGHSLSVADVQAHEMKKAGTRDSPSSFPNTAGADSEPHDTIPLSFEQIKALIEAERFDEIPNNKTISAELNPVSTGRSAVRPPKKPWEKDIRSETGSGSLTREYQYLA